MLQSGDQQGVEAVGNHAKKKTRRYKEREAEKVKAYQEEIEEIAEEKRVYIDKSGFQTYYDREYGYAPKGEKVFGEIAGKKYARTNLVAARVGDHILAPMYYNQNTNSEIFEIWFENQLTPLLHPGDVVIMDNASFHRKSELSEIAERRQIRVLFLPPYSPELNPIEKTWANIKRWLKNNIRFHSSFEDALCATIEFYS